MLFITTLLCLADGLVAGFKGETRQFQAIPGMELPITSVLPPETEDIAQLRILGQDEAVRLEPEAVFSGYWLGGTMWRGVVKVSPQASPGQRRITVEGPPLAPQAKPPIVFTIDVFATALDMQHASPSFITRVSGLEPFPISAVLFGLALPGLAISFFLSQRVESLMAAHGQAVIFLVKHDTNTDLIHFHLGLQNGIDVGNVVKVLKSAGQPVGEATVVACTQSDATAKVDRGTVLPGYIVSSQPGV